MDLNFYMTDEEISLSKKLVGVVARVIIPNGEPLTYLTGYTASYPECNMKMLKAWNWVSRQRKDFTVITNCPGIIMSVPTCCVRRINSKHTLSRIVSGESTFGGNIGEIYLDVFDLYGDIVPTVPANYIRALERRLRNGESVDPSEIEVIGETMIRHALNTISRNSLRGS